MAKIRFSGHARELHRCTVEAQPSGLLSRTGNCKACVTPVSQTFTPPPTCFGMNPGVQIPRYATIILTNPQPETPVPNAQGLEITREEETPFTWDDLLPFRINPGTITRDGFTIYPHPQLFMGGQTRRAFTYDLEDLFTVSPSLCFRQFAEGYQLLLTGGWGNTSGVGFIGGSAPPIPQHSFELSFSEFSAVTAGHSLLRSVNVMPTGLTTSIRIGAGMGGGNSGRHITLSSYASVKTAFTDGGNAINPPGTPSSYILEDFNQAPAGMPNPPTEDFVVSVTFPWDADGNIGPVQTSVTGGTAQVQGFLS